MFYLIFGTASLKIITAVSVIFAFLLTFFATRMGKSRLPRDGGRAYAINGSRSVGKPRGAGLIFCLCFTVSALLFLPLTVELAIYIVLTLAAMLTGYLDDASKAPWGELKKGLLDLVIAIIAAVTYLFYNPNTFSIAFLDTTVTLHPVVYALLIILLIWVSINVTNCSDGVDGLCATLSCITLTTVYILMKMYDISMETRHLVLLMVVCILAYLWYNASPSRILMGDAGSRAIGIFIAIAFLKLHHPLLYIPIALILILDGGLGLLKVSFMRYLHIQLFQKIRTPIHDHMRKNWEWSDTQVVARLAIMQVVICLGIIYTIF